MLSCFTAYGRLTKGQNTQDEVKDIDEQTLKKLLKEREIAYKATQQPGESGAAVDIEKFKEIENLDRDSDEDMEVCLV